jgi:hypothetical protein
MKCEDMLRILNEYVDGTLEAGVCEEFLTHLAGCNPCQVVIDNVRHTIRLFKDGRPYPMPEALKAKMRASLAAKWNSEGPSKKKPESL